MNKVFGIASDFALVREEGTRIVISYNMVDEGNGKVSWIEIYLPKKQNSGILTFNSVKEAIIADINAATDEKILTGFVWNNIPCWLSTESQFNFKAAYDIAVQKEGANLPVRFKLGESADENGNKTPVYYTFEDLETLDDFFTKSVAYINQCLNEGWAEKDGIDFSPYEALFNNEGE